MEKELIQICALCALIVAMIGRALRESSALMCKPDDSLSIRMLNDVLAMIFYHEDRVILSQTKVKYFGEKKLFSVLHLLSTSYSISNEDGLCVMVYV